ncbi:ParB/RepB/Spo0J family partition protein [Deltaproteobacteria bacterium OttesenSCG-928-K17]|nr:ParB/RepB/Spo0J family partition protein [Deltaproteobacteria bacterium OttesenSCG-928-K17]
MSAKDNKRLGRKLNDIMPAKGLDKILPKNSKENDAPQAAAGTPLMLDVNLIDQNPDQPRQLFDDKELESLARSIKSKGIIEPLVVTKKEDGRYELVAGERRLRAAQSINLIQVPVIIREISDDPSDRLVLALLENLCRQDLNAIEEAESFSRLEKDFGKTHQEIALMTGRERPTITNSVRLLKLPDFVQDDIKYARLTAGHGRAILGLSDHSLFHQLRTEIITKSLTVRQTELLVKKLNRKPGRKSESYGDEAFLESVEKSLTEKLGGLKVKIKHSGKNKKLEIFYQNNDELEWFIKHVGAKIPS